MSPISEKELKEQIKKENNVYIIFGNDGYLKNLYLNKIIGMYVEKDDIFNYQSFIGNCELQDVYDAVLQFPIMADRKVVVLADYGFEKCKAAEFDKLCAVISEVPDSCVFVLIFDALEIDANKNSKFTKLMTLADKNNGVTAELNHREIPELVKTFEIGAKKRGCVFSDNAARYLIEMAGEDIYTLTNELVKLCAFVGKGEITKQIIDEVSVKTVEASVYGLSKNIINYNMTAALKILDELFYLRVDPFIILATISGFYVDLYRAFVGRARGIKASDIASDFGYGKREFVVRNAMADGKKFDDKRFELSFDALRDADRTLKSFSGDDRTVLERLVVKLGFIALKGEAVD